MSNEKITRDLATLDLGYNPAEEHLFNDEIRAEIDTHLKHLRNGDPLLQDVSVEL